MAQATAAGDACRQMRALGIRGVNPSHPDLLALLAAGETPQNFADLAREIVERHPAKPMSYLLTVMRNRRSEQHAVPARAPAHRTDTQARPRDARPTIEPI